MTAEGVGVMCGWSEDLSRIEEVKRTTHDQLICSMGVARRGPISWIVRDGTEALKLVESLRDGASLEFVTRVLNPITYRLGEFGGWLVVAMADGEPDA